MDALSQYTTWNWGLELPYFSSHASSVLQADRRSIEAYMLHKTATEKQLCTKEDMHRVLALYNRTQEIPHITLSKLQMKDTKPT